MPQCDRAGRRGGEHGPNGDGCDPDSCENVVIRRVTFATHDDCVAIKSGRDQDGWRVGVPSRNVLIEDCRYLVVALRWPSAAR
ncbi:glycosyl hydrolase family 28 protein [Streptomyces sp. FXJ1.4098]|nr:glycosyl hydrolase family 28 protein [Streptomyces sp. FXJ1.4098]